MPGNGWCNVVTLPDDPTMAVIDLPDDALMLTDAELDAATEEEITLLTAYWRKELYKHDPVEWGKQVLGEFYWSKQRAILYAIQAHRKVAVRSCHEAGKDFIVARAALHWIQTGTPNRRSVVSTSASGDQVKAVLWKEINQGHKKGKLIGRTNLTEWYVNGEIVGYGRKVADYNPTSFHGTHAPEGVLVIYDEAGGVAEALFQAGNSMAGNERSRQVAIGNPDDPDSYFASMFRPGSEWHQIHIDGYDTPNFSGEPVPPELHESLLGKSYVHDLIHEYGEDSPIVVSKVRGNFPQDNKDGVVPWSKVSAAKYVTPDLLGRHDLGVDIAATEEGDGDATVIRERKGNAAMGRWTVHSSDPEVVADKVINVINETGANRVKVDIIGWGWGVAGILDIKRKQGAHSAKVIGVNVAEKSSKPQRFPNLRSQLWWEVGREPVMRGDVSTALMEDDKERTTADLIAPQYSINAKGLTVIEPKSETKKRLKRSPDDADAYLLAFYEPFPRAKGHSSGAQTAAARLPV